MENTFGKNINPDNDEQRISALRRYQILDTPPENAFDNVARLAAQIFKVPISLVSLVDADQVYFKANIGMGEAKVTSRGISLCSLAVLKQDFTVFENAPDEPCLLTNPNVAGSFGLKFYAGAPLTTHDGFRIGTLCVIDKTPRPFTKEDEKVLEGLAKIVMDEIELRLSAIQETAKLQTAIEEAAAINEELLTANEQLVNTQASLQENVKKIIVSEVKLKYMIADAPVGIGVLKGPQFIVESANNKLIELWGKTDEVIGKALHIALPELEGQPFFEILNGVLNSGQPFYGNDFYARLVRNGEPADAYFDLVYHPLKDNSGQATAIMVVATEVTDRVLARHKINAAEERLRLAVDAANLGSWFIDPVTKGLEYNNKLKIIFGYNGPQKMTYEQAIGQVTEEYREKITVEINKAISSGDDYDITYTQRRFNDNEVIWLRSIGKIAQDEKGNYTMFSGVVMDVTGQVNIRREIEDLNQQLSATNEEIMASNEELISTNDELKEIQDSLVLAKTKLEESEELKDIAIEQAKLGIWYMDAVRRDFIPSVRLKGFFGYGPDEKMPYEATVNQIQEDYRERVTTEVDIAIANGKPYDISYPIIEFRTNKLRWVRATGKLNPARNSRASYFSGTIMDVTEQKEDDQRKNDFISMVSHELKTPLTSMNGYIQMLHMVAKKKDDTFATGVLDKANKQVWKMNTMIDGFLNMKRLETGKIPLDKQPFDMADLIREMEEESTATISTHNIVFAPVEPTQTEADQDKIGQVINNLIGNAVKYSPIGSTINIACLSIGNDVQVSVKDRGMGISEEDQKHLFGRFYRVESKAMAHINGFGIGLYLCDEIITRHGGKIWVQSEIGNGATFYFSIPTRLQ
ncbi:PAS domain S-box-containing protein [Mucilaginibacter sp. UYNi724]